MFMLWSRSVSTEFCNMVEGYNISNAVATWVVLMLAFALSLATFIQSHNNVRPKLVQDGRGLVIVAR